MESCITIEIENHALLSLVKIHRRIDAAEASQSIALLSWQSERFISRPVYPENLILDWE